MLRILHTADWHLDLANLEFNEPAIRAGLGLKPYDLLVHAGDLVVNRSHVHPHVAWKVRELIVDGMGLLGAAVVSGNHDQSFQAERVGMVEGILGTTRPRNLVLASEPQTVTYSLEGDGRQDGPRLALVMVPTPNKYWLKAKLESADDPANELFTMIQSLIAQAKDTKHVAQVAVVYHGSVSGASLSDELQMPSGVDLTLPISAFTGADIVLAGHIHMAQELRSENSPPVYYSGAAAPLTWNDHAMRPAMYLHTFTPGGIESEKLNLPVVSQMLHMDVHVDDLDGSLKNYLLERIVTPALDGARVRVRVKGPGAVLDTINVDRLAQRFDNLRSLTVLKERTDSVVARMELERGFTIVEALEKWIELREVPGDLREDLLLLAQDIETKVRDSHLDARYEMEPVKLTLRNWCQYADVELDFNDLHRLVLIGGENYTGKSNLSRAIVFALYKKQLAGNKLADLIRKGQDELEVTMDFNSGGVGYRINRTVKRQSDGGATTQLHFLRRTAGLMGSEWEPMAEGTARETQAAIERLVGPLDLFLATSFAGQNAVDALLDLTPGELKDTLMSVLQRDFDSRLAEAAQIRSGIAAELQDCTRGRETLLSSAVEVTSAELAEAISRMTGAHMAQEEAESELADVEKKVTAAEAAADNLTAIQQDVAAARARYDDLAAEVAEAEQRAIAARQAGERLAGHRARLQIEPDVEGAAQRAAGARARLEKARQAGQERLAAHVAKHEEAAGDLERMRGEAVMAQRQVDELVVLVEVAQADVALLSGVPCGGEVWSRNLTGAAADTDTMEMGQCQFLQKARKAADWLPAATLELEQRQMRLEQRLTNQEDAAKRLSYLASAGEDLRAELKAECAQLESELNGFTTLVTEAYQVAQLNQGIKELIAKDERQASERAEWEARAELKRGAALTAGGERAGMEKRLEVAFKEGQAVLGLRTERDALRAQVATSRAAADKAVATHAQMVERRDRWREVNDRLNQLLARRLELDHKAAVAEAYAAALHRDGLPFLLLEQYAIPGLKAGANVYLAGTGLHLEVESEREVGDGTLRNSVEMSFTDHRGRHPIGAASGFQRTAIGTAIRSALADLLADATGSKIHLSVQDEGFGTMDPRNLEAAKVTIRTIAERRGWFLVISHVPGLLAVADSVVQVTDYDGISRLEVV